MWRVWMLVGLLGCADGVDQGATSAGADAGTAGAVGWNPAGPVPQCTASMSPTSDRCQPICKSSGMCLDVPGKPCRPDTCADCRQSYGCAQWGACTLWDAGTQWAKCRAAYASDCKASKNCALYKSCALIVHQYGDSNCDAASSCFGVAKAKGKCKVYE